MQLNEHRFMYSSEEAFVFTTEDVLPALEKASHGAVPVRRDLEAAQNPTHWAFAFAIHVVKHCDEGVVEAALKILFKADDARHVELAENIQLMAPGALSREASIVAPTFLWEAFWLHVGAKRYQSAASLAHCLLSLPNGVDVSEEDSLIALVRLTEVPERLREGVLKLLVLHAPQRLLLTPAILLDEDYQTSMMRFCTALGALSSSSELEHFYQEVRRALSDNNIPLDQRIADIMDNMIAARKKAE